MAIAPNPAEMLLDALADRIAARIGVGAERVVYTSISLPPRVGRRRFREVAPKIPGATKEGNVWIVPRSAWESFRTRRRAPATPTPTTPAATMAYVDRLLERAGLPVSGGRA